MQENQPETDKQKARRLFSEQQAEDLRKRKELGEQGRLYCIDVLFLDGNETRRYALSNQSGAEVLQFREKVFSAGLMVPIDPGKWEVIPPWNIKEITIQKQNKLFD
jgi:hypothetical protein